MDAIGDSRLSVFVTHGGMGSTREVAAAGVPALLIPLFADQTRNALMVQRHNSGHIINRVVFFGKNDLG